MIEGMILLVWIEIIKLENIMNKIAAIILKSSRKKHVKFVKSLSDFHFRTTTGINEFF